MVQTIRVLLAEDDPLAQHAINTYLSRSPDITLVGTTADGLAAVEAAKKLRPDVAIVDIHMPKLDGIETTRRLTADPINCKVVCFTALGDDEMLLRAIEAGASGFLLKSDSPGLILHGVRAAFSGDALVSPKLVTTLLTRRHQRSQAPADLNGTEQRMLTLIGRGHGNAEIGSELGLATSTVKTYVSRLLTRLGVRNRAALAARAHEWGFVE